MTTKAITLKYYSKDLTGNEEPVQTQMYNINLVDQYASQLTNIIGNAKSGTAGNTQYYWVDWVAYFFADSVLPHISIKYTVSYDGTEPPNPTISTGFNAFYKSTSNNKDYYEGGLYTSSDTQGAPHPIVKIKWVSIDSANNVSVILSATGVLDLVNNRYVLS